MKIVYLCHRTPYPPNKGERIRTFHQIEYLRRQGHDITILVPADHPDDLENLKTLKEAYGCETVNAPTPGRLALVKALLTGDALSVSNFYSKELQKKFDDFLTSKSVDSVVCTSSSMASYVFRSDRFGKLEKSPSLVMDFMDLDSDKWHQYQSLKPLPISLIYKREARLISQLELSIHDNFDCCIFISQAEIELFLKNTESLEKLRVIANGLDTDTFKPSANSKPSHGPNLLFTGVMDYLPNEDAVIWFVENAWDELKQRYPNARFYIVGMNPSQQVRSLGKRAGITVTGYVEDIMQYYDQAHIFIAPFRLARGVQNKVLQAFACALPTITTPMGCEGIDCEAGKEVLVANDTSEFIQHIDWIMNHPQQAEELGTQAMTLIRESFSWDGKLQDFEGLLQNKPILGGQ